MNNISNQTQCERPATRLELFESAIRAERERLTMIYVNLDEIIEHLFGPQISEPSKTPAPPPAMPNALLNRMEVSFGENVMLMDKIDRQIRQLREI